MSQRNIRIGIKILYKGYFGAVSGVRQARRLESMGKPQTGHEPNGEGNRLLSMKCHDFHIR